MDGIINPCRRQVSLEACTKLHPTKVVTVSTNIPMLLMMAAIPRVTVIQAVMKGRITSVIRMITRAVEEVECKLIPIADKILETQEEVYNISANPMVTRVEWGRSQMHCLRHPLVVFCELFGVSYVVGQVQLIMHKICKKSQLVAFNLCCFCLV